MPDDFAPLDTASVETAAPEDSLVVDVDGFEGPLDLLLTMARAQRVDLRKISILKLAERYLDFVAEARRLRIELAADYLVMAAWLAFLKSRLLLPKAPQDGAPSGDEMAARLARQLERLEAMRRAAAQLMSRPRLEIDVFARGAPETMGARTRAEWTASLSDLLQAYAAIKTREAYQPLHMRRPAVMTLEEAYDRLKAMLGMAPDWRTLAALLPPDWRATPARRRTAAASTFAAMLEMARRGEVLLRQDAPFAPVMLRPAGGRR
jgi:segregation and condensation protein A